MAGVEIAGLAVGVLPVIVLTAEAYRATYDKIRSFRDWSSEVQRLQARLNAQKHIYFNECQLLLQLVIHDDRGRTMLEDLDDKLWKDQELNDRMHKCLDTNVDVCRSLLKEVLKVLQQLDSDLGCFNEVTTRRLKDESIKKTIRRVRHSVTITLHKSKYEERLSFLREYNEDLGRLREQLGAFKRPSSCSTNSCAAKKVSLPLQFGVTQRASQKLHEALTTSWCCADAEHSTHCARLCLDAEAITDSVRFDLAISYHRSDATARSSSAPEVAPTWLYVRSTTVDTASGPLIPTGNRKHVRFTDEIHHSLSTNPRIGDALPLELSALSLCRAINMCDSLIRNFSPPDAGQEERCIGYLKSSKLYKHVVYASDSKSPKHNQAKLPSSTDIITLDRLLQRSIQDDLTLVDQLQLAHRTATAVLQYHSTSWLSDRWHLHDLALFGIHDEVTQDALRTLHVRSTFPETSSQTAAMPIEQTDVSKPGGDAVISAQDAQLLYGISNMTLFYLGVALLELGQWRTLQSLRRPDDANDIAAARRLATGRAPLGVKFQNIVRRCLQCDFGVGNDLSKTELQSAVYSDVVCELEAMINAMTI